MAIESVELDSDLVTEVRAFTGSDGVRDFIEAAVRRELENESFGRLLDELEAEAGPIPDEIAAEAERSWRAS